MATQSFRIKASGTDGVGSAVIRPPEDVDALLFYLPPSFVFTLSLSLVFFVSPDQDKSHIL